MTDWARSRALGPQRPMQQREDETSVRDTEPSSGRWDLIQARSWGAKEPPVTIRNRSGSRRVMVRSHLILPCLLSSEV